MGKTFNPDKGRDRPKTPDTAKEPARAYFVIECRSCRGSTVGLALGPCATCRGVGVVKVRPEYIEEWVPTFEPEDSDAEG